MKKSFFLLFVFIALTSCSSQSVEEKLSNDKKALFGVQEKDFKDENNYFLATITNEKKDDSYLVCFTLGSVKQSFHKVKVLVADEKKNTYFFGYNHIDYTLVKKEEEQDEKKYIYHGLRIRFSSTTEVDKMNVYFQSEEINFFFQTTK